jgi:hypothetical protein
MGRWGSGPERMAFISSMAAGDVGGAKSGLFGNVDYGEELFQVQLTIEDIAVIDMHDVHGGQFDSGILQDITLNGRHHRYRCL